MIKNKIFKVIKKAFIIPILIVALFISLSPLANIIAKISLSNTSYPYPRINAQTPPLYYPTPDYGYFTDNYSSSEGNFVLPKGLNGSTQKKANIYSNGSYFVTEISNDLDCSNWGNSPSSTQIGAAFIVLTMSGVPPATNTSNPILLTYTSCNNYLNSWEKLVNDYISAGFINLDYVYLTNPTSTDPSYFVNTRAFTTGSDVSTYSCGATPNCGSSYSGGIIPTIAFLNPLDPSGTPLYVIKYECGNPVGTLTSLPSLTPPTCSVLVTPELPLSDQSFTITITVNNPSDISLSLPTVTFSGTPNNPPITNENNGVYSVTLGGQPPGSYTFTFKFTYSDGGLISNSNCSNNTTIIPIYYYPYFQVNGSDTQVGLGFCGLSSNEPTASIYGWNHNGLNNSFNQGAGDQYGSISPGFLFGFDSANINGDSNPLGLSFSNVNNSPLGPNSDNPGSGLFGGFFKSLPPCGNNYFPSNTSLLTQITQNSNSNWFRSSGNYYVNGSFNINRPITIPQGVDVNLYVNGNVQISNNIQLNNLNAKTVSQLSSFKLIVERGNITIDPKVREIDGVYVAEPYKRNGGTIYTCGTTQPTTDCNTPLTVNGSLVANFIKLWRTSGTVGTSNVAETINQPPSEWLSSINNPGPLTINSIQNLPPVF